METKLYLGDCVEILKTFDENTIDTCITDPPYGLGFMGKEWDTFDKSQFGIAGNEGDNDLKVKKNFKILPRYNNEGLYDFTFEWAQAVYRVLKPGGLLLSFGGTRTYHRMVCGVEDAGFKILDTIGYVFATGFPKSMNLSKAIDKKLGAERKVIGYKEISSYPDSDGVAVYKNRAQSEDSQVNTGGMPEITAPATPEAQLWDGWGTALKPAMELIVVAQKPKEGTYAENALKWGVAGYWIDGGRVEYSENEPDNRVGTDFISRDGDASNNANDNQVPNKYYVQMYKRQGRFPANLIHDGSDEVLKLFPYSKSGAMKPHHKVGKTGEDGYMPNYGIYGKYKARPYQRETDGSEGSAARFFYCAKPSKRERNAGLEDGERNLHPTLKPLSLMRYLVRLTKTPTGGIVLDPFMGSGTTGIACVLEGRDFIGIEKEPDYYVIAEKRIDYWSEHPQE